MKILHSADWHLDSPLLGHSDAQAAYLRSALLKIPDKIASVCKAEGCDLLLLSGDLFDGATSKESLHAVRTALEDVGIPVFISPGNHDFCRPDSVYLTQVWPENVHIFTRPSMEAVDIPSLDVTVFGAGYTAMDCDSLLKHFSADGSAHWKIGVLHADPLQASSPYSPITAQQIRDSGLDYLALGHIHKGDSFRAGDTLCAWPGCPMGRGFDETGVKGALLVTLEEDVSIRFLPMDTPRFFDETVDVGENPLEAVAALLPPVPTEDFYRITLTGYSAPVDMENIRAAMHHVQNLQLRDRTQPEVDLWSTIGEDTLEGVYFKLLYDGLDTESEVLQRHLKLAARISRQILDGQEVTLP